MQRSHPYASSSNTPHPESGEYLVSWLDALSVQGNGWPTEVYSEALRLSHYSTDACTFVDQSFDSFAPAYHQGVSTMYQYQNHIGAPGAHSNCLVTPSPLSRHNTYAPAISRRGPSPAPYGEPSPLLHRDPSPMFYEEPSPPLPMHQSFPDFGLGCEPSIPSSPATTDTESVSTNASLARRQKSKIPLAADQPLTVDGKPRDRVYVACDRCRLRKLRCDGARPSCCQCDRVADQGVFCSYECAPRRRGQDKAPRIRSPVGQRKPRRPAVRKERTPRIL